MEEKDKKASPVYSETAYDDAFSTMEGRLDDLLVPFVSHMFGEQYDETAVVKRRRNEHYIEHEDGSEEKRITDSFFDITFNKITKRYHLECESKKYDGTILVRLFEYDTQIAKDTSEMDIYKARFKFPDSGVLLLRQTSEAPKAATIEIAMPDGRELSYDVPLVKMSDYNVEDIFRNKLYMLIPFLIFNYEDQLPMLDKNEESIDEFLNMYKDIFERLEKEQKVGNLSALSLGAIIRLTYSVAYKLTMNTDNVQKKVGDVMSGKILDLPEFKAYDQGVEQGIRIFIEDKFEDGIPVDVIKSKIIRKFDLSEDKANSYIEQVKASYTTNT